MKLNTTHRLIVIMLVLFTYKANSQIKNNSAEEFGLSIFESIKFNNIETFSNYLPTLGDTLIDIDRRNTTKKIVITFEMLEDLKNRLNSRFQYIQEEINKEIEAQNISSSQLSLKRITTEVEVRNNTTLMNTSGIDIILEVICGSKLLIINIEDCIKINNRYYLFDSLKIEVNEIHNK